MDRFDPYRTLHDKFMSMYVVILYGVTGDEVIDSTYKHLESLKKVRDDYKRKYINDRLFSLIEHFRSHRRLDDVCNETILLGKEIIDEFPLTKSEVHLLKQYEFPSVTFRHGDTFDFEYLHDLLHNADPLDVVWVMGHKLTHYHMTPTKQRVEFQSTDKNFDVPDYLDKLAKPSIIHGVSNRLKNIKLQNESHRVETRTLTNEQIWRAVDEMRIGENLRQLEDCFRVLDNTQTTHKVVVGKELRTAIEYQLLKTLFATSSLITRIRGKFSSELLNFDIVEIECMEPGDAGDRLIKDYRGAIGMKYF